MKSLSDEFRAMINAGNSYIGGEWVPAGSGAVTEVRNPATNEVVGLVPEMSAAETEAAITAASFAFKNWRRTTVRERSLILRRWFELIIENQEQLALILTMEQGKPLAEARGEVAQAAAYVEWFGEEARRIYGEIIPANTIDRRLSVVREPIGVVGVITPWNFPIAMITRKVAAALAAGCTTVVKPAAETPLSAVAVVALAERAGVPAGVINLVTGRGSVIGPALTGSSAVRKLSFTGSTEVGKQLAAESASTLKRLSLELGGNAPVIVFEDADLDLAIRGALTSKFRNAGQTCVAVNRIYVHQSVAAEFQERFAAAVSELVMGDGMTPGVQVGPLINQQAIDSVERAVREAEAAGATVLTGGRALNGLFFPPTVLSGVSDGMVISQEEIFGPVAPISTFESTSEVLERANATAYGLAAYFYTRDYARIVEVSEGLDFGMVGVNEALITTEAAPFGGVKDSGYGREGSSHGIDEYVSLKYVCVGGL